MNRTDRTERSSHRTEADGGFRQSVNQESWTSTEESTWWVKKKEELRETWRKIRPWITTLHQTPEGQIIEDIVGAVFVFFAFNLALIAISVSNIYHWADWVEKSIHFCHELSLVMYNIFLVLRLLLYLGWELYDELSP